MSLTPLRLLAADLGPESPLPPFSGLQRLPDPSSSPDLPPEMRERIAYGQLANPLPYPLQNGYSRDVRPRDIPALRLANGRLEALVLPGLGGRLWSLRDLVADRDLLFTNRRLQFANFALTDAWFAGGIEWNLGSTGHSATTSRQVFAGSVPSNRGAALRIWEWERTRDLVFSVDLLMPADRPLLLAFVRVRNPDSVPKPLYWWTNIAVPEESGVRVLAPAARAWRTGYDGSIARVGIPFAADDPASDISYPLPALRAADYFFEVPPEQRPWIAAVQADGRALIQTSTAGLRGRKLFCWGTAAGGRHWQEWLCGPGSRYLEIQAGLATTQLEHLRLEASAEISWAEAYASIEAVPAAVHGYWPDALAEIAELAAGAIPDQELDEWHRWWRAEVADETPRQLTAGSGAGEAELVLRGEDSDSLSGTPFGQPLSRRLPPPRHAGSYWQRRPRLRRVGCLDPTNHRPLGSGVQSRSRRLVDPTDERHSVSCSRRLRGGAPQLPTLRATHLDAVGSPRSGTARRLLWRPGECCRTVRPGRRPSADLPSAAGRGHRSTVGRGSTRRLPDDDRCGAGPHCCARPAGAAAGARPAGRRASGHGSCPPRGRNRGPRSSGGRDAGRAVARGVRRPAAAVPVRLPDASRPRPLRPPGNDHGGAARKLAIGLGVIAAARTMGARCCRSG